MYESHDSNHVKLLDFGLSVQWDSRSGANLNARLGTLKYCAPEVLDENYTSQCDLWSLGVVAYVLLSGVAPFSGSRCALFRKISSGRYHPLDAAEWSGVSEEAKDFISSLLHVNPSKRLTAHSALQHPWIAKEHLVAEASLTSVLEGLCSYKRLSTFQRRCWSISAWASSKEEQAKIRDVFLALNLNKEGSIAWEELRDFLVDYGVEEEEIREVFEALDYNSDGTIHYSDFLAATLSSRLTLSQDAAKSIFEGLDINGSGRLTAGNIKNVVGSPHCLEAASFVDGQICYEDFASYLEWCYCRCYCR
jgi:calcium-dependent protein kinase